MCQFYETLEAYSSIKTGDNMEDNNATVKEMPENNEGKVGRKKVDKKTARLVAEYEAQGLDEQEINKRLIRRLQRHMEKNRFRGHLAGRNA